MFSGRLVGIYTTTGAGAPMRALPEVRAIEGMGLDGDRYALGIGKHSRIPGTGRQLTLIEREAIVAVNAELDVVLQEGDARRNLVTEGVPLNHLVGRTFRIGDVVLRGVRLAQPCAYLASLTHPSVAKVFANRGGLRADIVVGGVLHAGDPIDEVDAVLGFDAIATPPAL